MKYILFKGVHILKAELHSTHNIFPCIFLDCSHFYFRRTFFFPGIQFYRLRIITVQNNRNMPRSSFQEKKLWKQLHLDRLATPRENCHNSPATAWFFWLFESEIRVQITSALKSKHRYQGTDLKEGRNSERTIFFANVITSLWTLLLQACNAMVDFKGLAGVGGWDGVGKFFSNCWVTFSATVQDNNCQHLGTYTTPQTLPPPLTRLQTLP